jgi:hypothetical protein
MTYENIKAKSFDLGMDITMPEGFDTGFAVYGYQVLYESTAPTTITINNHF